MVVHLLGVRIVRVVGVVLDRRIDDARDAAAQQQGRHRHGPHGLCKQHHAVTTMPNAEMGPQPAQVGCPSRMRHREEREGGAMQDCHWTVD